MNPNTALSNLTPNPKPEVSRDPAVAIWASELDAWLETPEGEAYLDQLEERYCAPADSFVNTDAFLEGA